MIIRVIVDWTEAALGFLKFGMRTSLTIPGTCVFRGGDVVRQFERVIWGSLPIVVVGGVSVGLVTWLQTRRLLVTYGIESTLPSILAAAVLVETGPMLASLMVAGRMGAGLGAELGSMVLTEEVDALEVLGAPVIPTLVAPRAIACALAVPFLTVILGAAALLGGLLAELAGGEMTARVYGQKSLLFLKISEVIPATLKTSVFGLLIGLIGCQAGLKADRSAESVGKAATRGVVWSMAGVFAANVVIVPLLQAGVTAIGWTG